MQEKVGKADLVIQNDGTLDQLLANAREALQTTVELVGGARELVAASTYGSVSAST